jgi:putative endonuclease
MLECSDGSYYTGWSVDPVKRVIIHNTGQGARYTRMHRPVRLVYIEEFPDRSSAQKRELAIKHLKHDQKEKLINRSSTVLENFRKQLPGYKENVPPHCVSCD